MMNDADDNDDDEEVALVDNKMNVKFEEILSIIHKLNLIQIFTQ